MRVYLGREEVDYSSIPEEKRKYLRSNTRLVSKIGNDGRSKARVNKPTLAEVLQGAKQVKRTLVEPYKEKLVEEGFSPEGTHFNNHMSSVEHKMLSFQKHLEDGFTVAAENYIAEQRQVAYRKVMKSLDKENKLEPCLTSPNWSFTERSVLLDTRTEVLMNSYVVEQVEIDLPPGRRNLRVRTDLENARYESGLEKGSYSHYGRELDYTTKVTVKGPKLIYHDELDELKHLYKCFWYGATYCWKNWIKALYDVEGLDSRVHSYNIRRFRPYQGDINSDTIVLFEVDFEEIEIEVDLLFHLIKSFRMPGKEYAIGGCEDHKLVLYSMLLIIVHHRDMESVIAGLRDGVLEDVYAQMGNLLSDTYDLDFSDTVSSTTDPNLIEFRESMPAFDIKTEAAHIEGRSFEEMVSQLHEEDDDSSSDGSDISTRTAKPWYVIEQENAENATFSDEEPDAEDILPYNPWKEAGTNKEFDSGREIPVPDIDVPDHENTMSGYDSDNAEDKPLSKLDKLGIDLIDPSQRQPEGMNTFRKLERVWNLQRGADIKLARRFTAAGKLRIGFVT
jgi:hypothetical protein